jgi:nucleoside-diphosphate-sugar epimerase
MICAEGDLEKRPKMKILVLGASGFIGQAICAASEALNVEIIRCQRQGGHGEHFEVRTLADIRDTKGLSRVMEGCETVIHLVAHTGNHGANLNQSIETFQGINVLGTQSVIKAAKETKIKRIVFMSSIKVNGEETKNGAFTEKSPPEPEDIYGQTKFNAESILRHQCDSSGIEWVILRPPLVYGPGVRGNFRALIKLSNSGLPLPLSRTSGNKRSMIASRNLASATLLASTHPKAARKVFLVRDGLDISTGELVARIRSELGKPAHLVPIPPNLMRGCLAFPGASSLARRIYGSLTIDDSYIRERLGWEPPVTLDMALKETVNEWLAAQT